MQPKPKQPKRSSPLLNTKHIRADVESKPARIWCEICGQVKLFNRPPSIIGFCRQAHKFSTKHLHLDPEKIKFPDYFS